MDTGRSIRVRFSFTFLVLTLVLVFGVTSGADDKDKEECTEQLVGLATCLPYVGGNAKSPTPDCCSGLKQVLNTNKKCLCVVIKDRNDPDLGLTINVTLALGLPTVCHAPANVSKCPASANMTSTRGSATNLKQPGGNISNNGRTWLKLEVILMIIVSSIFTSASIM
ncbi:Bifunctional inhibitor/plant lipid transfer protein/seed storage helical domain-containing protein [Cynara cardunculus var. scolymus]|uniref:Bifunctional inhibitor/plant lipid transfer protein/seed storage helical domain-containing protein n=1 Tax=Cynara cardunculus var. scolymus TaxID=59895 RepID=A0A118JSK2_CYNCS|nr:Bifunctional inhibitor/plant lipid transfer protein/seed storage helical domain-containing protein [Cynara cardunculus var. scolymus]